ncbi:hypothetical protein HDR63_02380 [bacterium]|nr:hypothetical protein [bacterium]
MKRHIARCLMGAAIAMGAFGTNADARNLTATASVNVTSDTAAMAKNMAIGEARRQIIRDVLGQYADVSQLDAWMAAATDADLTNLIAASGIDNERLSSTTYSANITMTLERDAARAWLNDGGVQNWLGDVGVTNRSLVVVAVPNGLGDWIDINSVARGVGVSLDTRRMMPRQIVADVAANQRALLTAALRDAGWRYADDDGVLHIWR